MYLTEHFGLSLGALVIWGFMMAFFFNIFLYFATPKKSACLLFTSFIMFASYFSSDSFFSWFSTTETYLHWAFWDIATFLIILFFVLFNKPMYKPPAYYYVSTGLILNSILFLLIYYDIYIKYNKDPWLLWDIYSFGVNIVDFTMIVALIVDRDILGLIKLKNGIKALFKGQQQKHLV